VRKKNCGETTGFDTNDICGGKATEDLMNDQHEKQMQEAEEILGERLEQRSFAKTLFFGEYVEDSLPRYPVRPAPLVDDLVERLRQFCAERIDPVAIDRQAEIPRSVIDGLGQLGVLGACLPESCGGLGLSQTAYCRLLEVLGGHCASTALFVNAHHSIGPRAVVLFGTEQQRQQWLPKLASGEWISAFALTEPEAGSDAGNVRTTATPTEDGRGYRLNGEKRWITNGGIAQVLTVMARTPVGKASKITAFLVTPDMPGFKVLETRMEKCGVRGTATSRLAFEDMFVPRENILGELGKGLRVALTVLDFGRTTFGASCTGAAKFCLERARRHVRQRVQFDKRLAEFELVQEKIADMHAAVFAMESCTYQTAALIDAGQADFMIETAMLKVFSTECLWKIIYDTFQLHGGLAYFTDQPFERAMRDARINSIGEGANDVLRVFSGLVGMRDVGLELQSILEALQKPLGNLGRLRRFAGRTLTRVLVGPDVPVRCSSLEPFATRLAADVASLSAHVERLLRTHQQQIVDRQCQVARIADAATEIYVCACVLRRLDLLVREQEVHGGDEWPVRCGRHYLLTASRRIRRHLATIADNDDEATLALGRDSLLRGD
jgi:acyl-CoA dehydrogenase family member 9